MTAVPVPSADFYVYALFREDGITPFYIGKGRGSRIDVHERYARRGTSHKDRIIQGMLAAGIEIPKAKLVECLSDPEAKQIEVDLIALVGRWPRGPLANLTSGGDGVADLSQRSRARKSSANVASWSDPVVRRKRLAGIAAVWTPKRRAAHGALIRSTRTPESRAAIASAKREFWRQWRAKAGKHPIERPKRTRSNIAKSIWQNPESRAKIIASRKAYRLANPMSAQQRKAFTARLTSPEVCAKSCATNRQPAVRAKRIAAQKAAFSTPEARAKRSAVSKLMWARKKAAKEHQ